MKFSIFTVMLPEWDHGTALARLAAAGYDGVEWRVTNTSKDNLNAPPSYWGHNLATVELDTIVQAAPGLKKMTDEVGMETAGLAGYHTLDNIDATSAMLQAAKVLGAPLIRVNAPRYDGKAHYDGLLAAARKDLAKTAGLAARAGVKVCVETHMGQIAPSASAARRLLDGLDPSAVGVIYDPGNMVTEGQEQTKMGLEILGPYLAHVHVKNGAWSKRPDAAPGENPWTSGIGTPLDEGVMDWGKVIQALREVGYDGYLSFEDFSSGRSTEDKVAFNIGYIKSLLARRK